MTVYLSAEACCQLALRCRDGTEAIVDPIQAAHYFHLAAAQGHANAKVNLDQLLTTHPQLVQTSSPSNTVSGTESTRLVL